MQKIFRFILIFSILFIFINAQKLGEIAPPEPPLDLPPNSFGVDVIFNDAGFGLGTFYKYSLNEDFITFVDFSIAETKDDREIVFFDYFGNPVTYGKINRSLILPLNFGFQYRLFKKTITNNLRPYFSAAVGPTMIMVTPYIKNKRQIDFFAALKYATLRYTIGGYVGFGANFGTNKKRSLGISVRYYIVHLLGEGIENIKNKYRKDLSSIYVNISIGFFW